MAGEARPGLERDVRKQEELTRARKRQSWRDWKEVFAGRIGLLPNICCLVRKEKKGRGIENYVRD
jgi:hypothetical protein